MLDLSSLPWTLNAVVFLLAAGVITWAGTKLAAFGDRLYVQGSLYHAESVGEREAFLPGLAIALNVVLLLGQLYRQRAGPANMIRRPSSPRCWRSCSSVSRARRRP